MVRTPNMIYILTPQQKNSENKESTNTAVHSIRAVALTSRTKLWEKILNGAQITNIVLNSTGGLLYASGEKVFCLNAETGDELGRTAIDGEAQELALGASDKLIVKIKKKDGSQSWVTLQAPCKR